MQWFTMLILHLQHRSPLWLLVYIQGKQLRMAQAEGCTFTCWYMDCWSEQPHGRLGRSYFLSLLALGHLSSGHCDHLWSESLHGRSVSSFLFVTLSSKMNLKSTWKKSFKRQDDTKRKSSSKCDFNFQTSLAEASSQDLCVSPSGWQELKHLVCHSLLPLECIGRILYCRSARTQYRHCNMGCRHPTWQLNQLSYSVHSDHPCVWYMRHCNRGLDSLWGRDKGKGSCGQVNS